MYVKNADLAAQINQTSVGIFQPEAADRFFGSLQYSATITRLTKNYNMTLRLSGLSAASLQDPNTIRYFFQSLEPKHIQTSYLPLSSQDVLKLKAL